VVSRTRHTKEKNHPVTILEIIIAFCPRRSIYAVRLMN